jgi:hypothetical protein
VPTAAVKSKLYTARNPERTLLYQTIAQSLQAHCPGAANVEKAALHIGAVALIHRSGSSLNEHRSNALSFSARKAISARGTT